MATTEETKENKAPLVTMPMQITGWLLREIQSSGLLVCRHELEAGDFLLAEIDGKDFTFRKYSKIFKSFEAALDSALLKNLHCNIPTARSMEETFHFIMQDHTKGVFFPIESPTVPGLFVMAQSAINSLEFSLPIYDVYGSRNIVLAESWWRNRTNGFADHEAAQVAAAVSLNVESHG